MSWPDLYLSHESDARGHSHMISALKGEGVSPKADDSIDRLRDFDSDKGGTVSVRALAEIYKLFGFYHPNTSSYVFSCPIRAIEKI